MLDTLGATLAGQGELSEADSVYERAVKNARRTPNEADILRNHADVLTRLGRTTDAQEMKDRALEIEAPGSPSSSDDTKPTSLPDSEAGSATETEESGTATQSVPDDAEGDAPDEGEGDPDAEQ